MRQVIMKSREEMGTQPQKVEDVELLFWNGVKAENPDGIVARVSALTREASASQYSSYHPRLHISFLALLLLLLLLFLFLFLFLLFFLFLFV